jgi:hypothetical protein
MSPLRKTLAGAVLGAGLLSLVQPAPASADCNVLVLVLTGQCHNACTVVALAYRTVDRTAFDALPDRDFVCLA